MNGFQNAGAEPRTFLSGKKILITGGTGHLGSALVHRIIGNLKLEPSAISIFYLAGTPTQSLRDIAGLNFVPGDIRRFDDVRWAFEGMDYVFHLAASTSFDPRQIRAQWMINVEGTRNVLEAFRQSPLVRRLCYTSTVNVLGVPDPPGSIGDLENSNPYTSRPRLHSFDSADDVLSFADDVHQGRVSNWKKRIGIGYFDSKLAAQELADRYGREFGLDIVSVLPGTIFGPYDFLIGSGLYLLSIFRGQMPGVLKGGISAVHVMDAVEGHLLAMERAAPGARYIISGRREDNFYFKELAAVVADVLRSRFPAKKIRRPSLVFPRWLAGLAAWLMESGAKLSRRPCLLSGEAVRAGSVPLFYSCESAAKDLGYQPKRTFRQAVDEMIRYYQAENLFAAEGRFVDLEGTP